MKHLGYLPHYRQAVFRNKPQLNPCFFAAFRRWVFRRFCFKQRNFAVVFLNVRNEFFPRHALRGQLNPNNDRTICGFGKHRAGRSAGKCTVERRLKNPLPCYCLRGRTDNAYPGRPFHYLCQVSPGEGMEHGGDNRIVFIWEFCYRKKVSIGLRGCSNQRICSPSSFCKPIGDFLKHAPHCFFGGNVNVFRHGNGDTRTPVSPDVFLFRNRCFNNILWAAQELRRPCSSGPLHRL